MSDLEREQQRKILELLNTVYPAKMYRAKLAAEMPEVEESRLPALVKHLDELGYVTADIRISSDGLNRVSLLHATITARGRDYLKPDGGLTAERDALVVRLHADTIRDMLVSRIEQSELEGSAKAKLIDQVKSLPAKGLEAMVTALAQQGLALMPGAILWLQTLIPHVSK